MAISVVTYFSRPLHESIKLIRDTFIDIWLRFGTIQIIYIAM